MRSDESRIGLWLDDILQNIDLVESFTDGIGFDEFKIDKMRLYAVVRGFEIISEASRRLPDTFKARQPSVQWQALAAAGNVFRHEYGEVSPERLWHFLTHAVPPLRTVVEAELANFVPHPDPPP